MTWRNDARHKRANKMRRDRKQAVHDLAYGASGISGSCYVVTHDDMKAAVNAARHAAYSKRPLTVVRGWVRLGAHAWVDVRDDDNRRLFIRREGKDTNVPVSDTGQEVIDSILLRQP